MNGSNNIQGTSMIGPTFVTNTGAKTPPRDTVHDPILRGDDVSNFNSARTNPNIAFTTAVSDQASENRIIR